ncbi:type II secretion system protein [Lachnospiraceae bacterium 62-35]
MKNQKGFSLIEMLAAIAVLSVLAGVLLRVFIISSRLLAQSEENERAMSMAEGLLEGLKAASLEELDTIAAWEDENVKVLLEGSEWEVIREDKKYLFTRTIKEGPFAYIIEGEADYGKYGGNDDEYGLVESINLYEMPSISHVDSIENVVISPDELVKEDELLESKLLAKMNLYEEDPEHEEIEEQSKEEGPEEIYTSEDIKKILNLIIDWKSGGEEIRVSAQLIYTAASDSLHPDQASGYPAALSARATVFSQIRRVAETEEGKEIKNRIYIFLPDSVVYEKVFITSAKGKESCRCPVYLVVPFGMEAFYTNLEQLVMLPTKGPGPIILFSNIPREDGESNLTGREPARNRLYGLSATVYRAEEGEGGEMKKTRMLIRLTSSKRE